MKKFSGCLILSDMDGTILNSDKEISQENINAVKYFVENGGLFSLATGRAKRSMEYYVRQLPINAPVVVYNGSGVYDFQANSLVSEQYMDKNAVAFVEHLCGRFVDLAAEIYLADSEYVVQPNEISRRHFEIVRLDMVVLPPKQVPQPWVKVNFVAPEELVLEVERYAVEHFSSQYFFQRSGRNFFEAMSHGVDKGTGALEVCRICKIDPKRLYVIGDHMNDVELMEVGAISFAPANAVEHIKAMADVIVADNNHHAVADMINYLDKQEG